MKERPRRCPAVPVAASPPVLLLASLVVERRELLELVLDVARDAGIEIRTEPVGAPVQSGVCRVRGAVWLVLSAADPLEDRLAVAAAALREHAGPLLEERYLPPAVRELLDLG